MAIVGDTSDPQKGNTTPLHPDATIHPAADGAATTPATTDHTLLTDTGEPATDVNKLTDEGLLCWTSDMALDCRKAWSTASNVFDSATGLSQAQHIRDIDSLTFDSAYGPTSGSTPGTIPTPGDTPPTTSTSAAGGGGGGGFSGFMSDLGNAVKDASGTVTSPLDWLFNYKDPAGDSASISANNGEASFNGSKDGNNVDVKVNQTNITGRAGDLQFNRNKQTGETTAQDGPMQIQSEPGETIATDTSNGYQMQINTQNDHWVLKNKQGQVVGQGDNENTAEQSVQNGQVTTTTGSADSAADQAAQQLHNGQNKNAPPYQYFVDSSGNYGVVSNDGLVIKTYKDTGMVTLEQNGHEIRINKDHQVQAEVNGQWVNIRDARGFRLPEGMQVNGDGSVSVNGKKVVDSNNNVQVNSQTTISTSEGKMSTTGTNGQHVQVQGGDGTATVQQQNGPTMKHDASGTTFVDPKTGKPIMHYDAHSHHMQMTDPDGTSVNIDSQGTAVMRDSRGQVTTIGEDGTITTMDAQGHNLMSVDSNGDVVMYDGTTIDADGDVTNGAGTVGSAWDNGQNVGGAIAAADSIAAAAVAAAQDGKGNPAQLAGLASMLENMAESFSAQGKLEVVGQIDAAKANVEAAASTVASTSPAPKLADAGSDSPTSSSYNSGYGPAA